MYRAATKTVLLCLRKSVRYSININTVQGSSYSYEFVLKEFFGSVEGKNSSTVYLCVSDT